ncbi:MAG TPA: hypothetical protein VF245_02505 [Solirubrobacterales bacterium]
MTQIEPVVFHVNDPGVAPGVDRDASRVFEFAFACTFFLVRAKEADPF